jgi:hypothetical protein
VSTKHTPGPWAAGQEFNDYTPISGQNWHDLCQVATSLEGYKDAEGAANLRLISAAPGLLSALTRALASLRAELRPEIDRYDADLIKECEAAIAKAVQS